MLYQIQAIETDADHHRIRITYSDNIIVNADFNDLMDKGVMRLLKNPAVFKQVQIGNKGRSILWQEQDIDFCADSLRLQFYHSEQ